MRQTPVAVVGGGGHAKVVIDVARAAGVPVLGVFDDDPAKAGRSLLDVPVIGGLDELPTSGAQRAVVAIGSNGVRRRIVEWLSHLGLEWATLVHPGAIIAPSASVGAGSVICAGAIVQAEASVGDHCIVNTGASVDHDCRVGDFVHIAPGARLSGGVSLGEGTWVGTGAAIIQYLSVGAWTMVGAGAAVVADLPDGVTAVGVPARALPGGAGTALP